MSETDQDLLRQFEHEQSQDAFTELVKRQLPLVYSAALRQVRSAQLAEEVAQSVFTQLARQVGKFRPNTVLSAWLYQVTRCTAIDVVRREARRQAREQIAFQMSELNEPNTGWEHIEPLLDEAMHSLDEPERTAILLRFFENKSLREVGEALGASDDAAQKRVSRGVEHLRDFFAKRKIAIGATGLVALVSANAIQAAPAGLAPVLSAGAVVGTAAISTSTAVHLTTTIAMTTLQKTIITVALVGAVGFGVYQARQASTLKTQVESLTAQQKEQTALKARVQTLEEDLTRATNSVSALTAENAALKKNPTDVLKLRGDVGRLKQEKAQIASTSALSKITANPDTRKMVRDQQKMGMGIIYKSFAANMKFTKDQTDKFNDVLADHIMENVGNVTTALRDKLSTPQMDNLFSTEDAALQQKLQDLLGPDGATQYQDYTRNLLANLTSQQFRDSLTGTDAEKDAKANQLKQLLQDTTQAALAQAGLPADYQTVPILNFRNIVSEQEADKSLKLMQDIYQRVATSSASFLSPDEITKFQEFQTKAMDNNKMALTLNRTMMAPIAQ